MGARSGFWMTLRRCGRSSHGVRSRAHGCSNPAPAYRVRRDTNTRYAAAAGRAVRRRIRRMARSLTTTLAPQPSGRVTLEIVDAQGKLVRRYSSTDKPDPTEDDLKKLEIPSLLGAQPRSFCRHGRHASLGVGPALRRARISAARLSDFRRAARHSALPLGPRALPGVYTVRLTAGGRSITRRLTVKMDPRVKTPPAGLRQQFEMEMQLASMMTRSTVAIQQARAVREQMEGKDRFADLRKKIEEELARAAGEFGPEPQTPSLVVVNGEASALYGAIDGVDAAPVAAQSAAMSKLSRDAAASLSRWDALKTEIAGLNRQLHAAQLPEIRLDAQPEHASDDDDSDVE